MEVPLPSIKTLASSLNGKLSLQNKFCSSFLLLQILRNLQFLPCWREEGELGDDVINLEQSVQLSLLTMLLIHMILLIK